jgi:hypothetical protein
MQDYLDIIDQEGLLTNVQEEAAEQFTEPKKPPITQKRNSMKAAAGINANKRVTLAKLPEENKDGWAQLEQDMNKES